MAAVYLDSTPSRLELEKSLIRASDRNFGTISVVLFWYYLCVFIYYILFVQGHHSWDEAVLTLVPWISRQENRETNTTWINFYSNEKTNNDTRYTDSLGEGSTSLPPAALSISTDMTALLTLMTTMLQNQQEQARLDRQQ